KVREALTKVGAALFAQTDAIAPADRILYALRDVTGTVENLSLIVASILSKKLASGTSGIVFDVKTGDGALLKSVEGAHTLGRARGGSGRARGGQPRRGGGEGVGRHHGQARPVGRGGGQRARGGGVDPRPA